MRLIPSAVFKQYAAHLRHRGIAAVHHSEYQKWLRYFLDFCDKYPVPNAKSERVRLFCEKLRDKKQSEAQRERAAHAISLYFEMKQHEAVLGRQGGLIRTEEVTDIPVTAAVSDTTVVYAPVDISQEPETALVRRQSQYTDAGYQVKSKSCGRNFARCLPLC
jgi:hypothetical protein